TTSPPSDLAAQASGGFQRTVSDLRKSGLEIVFVFDSTGSMSRTIHDTKTTIVQMLAVLRALVPDARVGIVTYRDHDKREDYVVRQVPLGSDFWQASNFVQFVTAEGGGDRPEDVRAGMRAAFEQKWRTGARRVVVLAGDAPPHEEDEKRLLAEVASFAKNGRSFVHTLVTSPDQAGADTHAVFREIAAAGKGTCQGLNLRDRVLQRVLTLAFGREFDQDLAVVIRAVEAEQRRVDVKALDLARRGGPELAAALRQDPVPQELWNALVRRPRRAIAEQMVEMLGATDTPAVSRQAIAAALQRIFEMSVPPIDPADPEPPSGKQLAELRKRARAVEP
ncbi:MAG: vWA domain-containing protein, partial [Planctomycetota bacterium]